MECPLTTHHECLAGLGSTSGYEFLALGGSEEGRPAIRQQSCFHIDSSILPPHSSVTWLTEEAVVLAA